MAIAIETGIPMPEKPSNRGGSKYPFADMKVGDSFIVDLSGKRSWAFIFAAIKIAQDNYTGRKFSTRLIEDSKRRVWRTA